MGALCVDPERAIEAQRHYLSCTLCEHRCRINRLAGQRGPCKAGPVPRLIRHRIEYSEESDLIPSHLFYLSGCDLRCVFCIAELNAFDPSRGQELTSDYFNEAVAWGVDRGAKNIEWVGGEPTIHLPYLLDLMANCPNLPPVIWKSDFHFTPEALDLLNGVVDVYLADYKFGNEHCALRLGGGEKYLAAVQRNLLAAAGRGRLIVRHLLLPGHTECCFRPIAQWMQENLPEIEFSLRLGYLPSWRSEQYVELKSPVTRAEGRQASRLAEEFGLRVIQ
ncbi:MAG TPA: radical SAM protein [Tepidisphaeraceae bacterium]|nr:radical SAM protein [Tepidisphaeraceae bacterium]